MAITEAKLKNAKTKKKKYALSVGKSLYLAITPSGTKSWKYRFLLNNKSGDYTIGEYPLISLDDASTALNEMGYRSDLSEKQFAHGDANKIRAVYNKAKYLPERIEMMEDF